MRKKLSVIVLLALLLSAAAAPAASAPSAAAKTLPAFSSDAAIAALFKKWSDERQRRADERRLQKSEAAPASAELAMQAAPAAKLADRSSDAPGRASDESITNVQHAGVDEGGIVKLHGDHLVILRRGRLFTVDVSGGRLRSIATADAYGNGIDPRGAWYDEMLIAGNTIVVIGFSYARGGTEIGLFEISPSGNLAHKGTYHLRSNDYYSSRNYASRLIDSKLIFYTPLYLNPWAANPFAQFPAMRRWQQGATPADFKRIAPATSIYRTDEELDPNRGVALHTVTTCDLARSELDCNSTAVLGPPGRVFYVSETSVFVWTTPGRGRPAAASTKSAVFRIPLDAGAPSALKASGSPIDQFSFLESGDGHLNVLLRGSGMGDGMWSAERPGGQLALLRVPLASFSDGREAAPRSAYRALPTPPLGALQSRYIGPYLVYGAGAGWRRPKPVDQGYAYAVRYADGSAHEIALPHGVDRIEALGDHAVAIGSAGSDLHFTSLRLDAQPALAGRYTQANAAQGETRSHGFFYRRQADEEGLVGLPIIGGGQAASSQLRRTSAALLYLRNRGLVLSALGTLNARAEGAAANDACKASCVDWYGNARPLFLRGRIFALMGYELVEGTLTPNGIVEARRIDFAPHWVDLMQ